MSPPYKPSLKGPFDSDAFEAYPESTEEGAPLTLGNKIFDVL